jgi:hypothetical protein
MPRIRSVLLEPLVLYVSPNGSDLNQGMIASESLRTVQAAVDYLAGVDHQTYLGTIRLDAGSYAGFSLKNHVGLSSLRIEGAGASTIIEGEILGEDIYSEWQVRSLRVRCDGNSGLWMQRSVVMLNGLTFEVLGDGGSVILADDQSGIYVEGGLTFNAAGGDLDYFVQSRNNSVVEILDLPLSLGATPNLSQSFLFADNLSLIRWANVTVTGSATGNKAIVKANSVIDLGNASQASIPGDGIILIESGGRVSSSAASSLGISPPPLKLRAYDGTSSVGAAIGLQEGLPLIFLRSYPGTRSDVTTDARIVVSPSSFDFGTVEEQEESQQINFLIKNEGQKAFTVSQVAIASGNATDFVLSDLDCGAAPFSIAGGRACSVQVKFAPGAILTTGLEESRAAKLVIESNAGNEAITEATLSGKAASKRGILSWADPEYELPSVEQGQSGTPVTVSLRNTGKTAIPIAEIGLSGKDTLAFSLDLSPADNPCGGSPTILPGDFCNVEIYAIPPIEADSVDGDVVKVCFVEARPTNTDINTARTEIAFTATERKPSLVVVPGEFVTMTGTLTSINTVSQNITIRNDGTGKLEIFSAKVENTSYPNPITKAVIEDPTISPGPDYVYLDINTNALNNRVNPFTVKIEEVSSGGLPPYEIAGAGTKTMRLTLDGAAVRSMLEREFQQYPFQGTLGFADYFTIAMFDIVLRHNDQEKGVSVGTSEPVRETTLTLACKVAL